jgi:CRISPR/Cas system-associated exonuclease Cas4 (RecB family)
MQTTLTLFDTVVSKPILPKVEKKKISKEVIKVGWSYSKMEMLKSCPRKYYYNYFGAGKRKAKEDTNKSEIAFLSKMSNIHTTVGTIVHESIAIFLRKRQKEEEWNFEQLKWLAEKKLNDTIDYTVKLKNGEETNNPFPLCPIKELFYNTSLKDEIIDFAKAKINISLEHFYNSEDYEKIRDNGFYIETIVESMAKFKLDNTNIDGVIDIAFEDDGKFHIVDWKTSHYEPEETSVQLLVYALWAIEKHGKEIDEINIYKAYLLDGKIEPLEFTQKHLDRAKAKIRQSVEEMTMLEQYGIDGIIEAFDCCDEPKVCKLCPFEKICKSSKIN